MEAVSIPGSDKRFSSSKLALASRRLVAEKAVGHYMYHQV